MPTTLARAWPHASYNGQCPPCARRVHSAEPDASGGWRRQQAGKASSVRLRMRLTVAPYIVSAWSVRSCLLCAFRALQHYHYCCPCCVLGLCSPWSHSPIVSRVRFVAFVPVCMFVAPGIGLPHGFMFASVPSCPLRHEALSILVVSCIMCDGLALSSSRCRTSTF